MEIRISGHKAKVNGRKKELREKIEKALKEMNVTGTLVITFQARMNRVQMPENELVGSIVEVIPLKTEFFDESDELKIIAALAEVLEDETLEVIFVPPVKVWIGRRILR